MNEIKIDSEFESLIPPLTDAEFKQLEENCVKDGIRDALIVWEQNGENILVDGHNRFKIIQKHNLNYRIEKREFDDRESAVVWIADNQLGRRNLIPYDRVLLEDKKRDAISRQAKEKMESTLKQNMDTANKISCQRKDQNRQEQRENSTDYKIAKAAGVSEDTVRKVRTIDKYGTQELKDKIHNKEISINKASKEAEKVKAIENSGNDFLKQQVRDGKTTIDQAYKVVTDTVSKSPAQVKKEFIDSIKQEVKDFQEKKKEDIVSLGEINADAENRKVLAKELHNKILRMGNSIDQVEFDMKNSELSVDELLSEWSHDERKHALVIISKITGKLQYIREAITK